jgi:hypothetical protein
MMVVRLSTTFIRRLTDHPRLRGTVVEGVRVKMVVGKST